MLAVPGSIAGAQNQIAPVAVAAIGEATTDQATGVTTVQLDGSASFDPDPEGSIATYRWEVVTEAYQWVEIDDGDSATASFEVPSAELAARYGPSIEFRLTITDSGTPPATVTATVVFNLNRGPVADITVSAKLPAPRGTQIDGYDDDGDGVVDENSERYTREGVIHGPGDNGNADYEWDVREGSLVVIDGSGSFDADGPLPASAFSWERLYTSDVASVTATLPESTTGQKTLSTDEDPNVAASISSETVARLPFVSDADNTYYLFYMLTVTDEHGMADSQIVKIVIRDAHDHPTVELSHPESNPDASTAAERQQGVLEAGENRYVVLPEIAEKGVTLIAEGVGDGSARTRELSHTWRGTGVEPSESNELGARSQAVFTAPVGTGEGDSFTVQVEVVDPDGLRATTQVELLVVETTSPTATAPPEIETPDGPDGGYPVSDPPTGVVSLRGFGFDPDGDSLTFKWEQVQSTSGTPLSAAFRGPRVVLSDSTSETAWFALPEVIQGNQYTVYVQFTVTDTWGVFDSDIVTITIHDGDDDLKAIAGPTRRVVPGGFVRLHGGFDSGLVSADAIASVTYTWAYAGIETHPRTGQRPPITDAEKALGYVFGEWFPHDGLDDDGDADPNEARGTYSADAGGRVSLVNGRYPYFDAPELGGFNSVKLIFELTVGGLDDQEDDTDTVAVLVLGPFFSGVIDGPDYCANRSLGGSVTYPVDSDSDGVADICALNTTRRAAIARQNALERLASLNPDGLRTALHGPPDDPETTDVDESDPSMGTCYSAPKNLPGDTAEALEADACGADRARERRASSPPPNPPGSSPDR